MGDEKKIELVPVPQEPSHKEAQVKAIQLLRAALLAPVKIHRIRRDRRDPAR